MQRLKGLYVITDDVLTPDESVVAQVGQSLDAGAAIVQYRNKIHSDEAVESTCRQLQELCRQKGALFVIDDRPYLAQKIGADGLHIGKDDIKLEEARKIFTKGIIGVSCYGSVRLARQAEEEGADYVAFGSFFSSPTKPHSGIVSKSVLRKANDALSIPVCAIGGINLENISEVAEEGPAMIAVVSAVFQGDIINNTCRLIERMNR